MHSLILAVLSIVLMAGITVASISYIPTGEPVKQQVAERTTSGFEALEAAWQTYAQENQTHTWACETHTGPATNEVFEDCERVVDDPGYLAETDWPDALIPDYTFEPNTPAQGVWSYSNDESGNVYFCLSDNFDALEREGIERAERNFSSQAFVISSACGDTSDQVFAESYSGSVAVTLWIRNDGSI